jgi:enoyl-CoA hydratase/carnithine racemase
MTGDARFHVDVDGSVATITLDRPDRRNAQTPLTWLALGEIGEALADDIRIVVVRGEGSTFSAGLDRAMFSPEGIPGAPTFRDVACAPVVEGDRTIEAFQQGFAWLSRPEIISVAAVQGHAVGAGFQLALEICATGRPVTATEAARIGLVTTVVPPVDLDAAVGALVEALLRPPREALAETKALLRSAGRREPQQQLAAERQAQLRLLRRRASEETVPGTDPSIEASGRRWPAWLTLMCGTSRWPS